MSNPRDFLLNTDYELDKIILVKTGSFVGSVEIPHDLGFAPLPFGVWSTSQDFNTVNSIGVTDNDLAPGYTPFLGVDCDANSTRIKLVASGNGSNSTTIYYRLYAFEPSGLNKTAPITSDLANTFILNTDYNYRKLLTAGTFTQSNQSYTHNLGYLPQVMAWGDYSGFSPQLGIEPIMGGSDFTNYKLVVTPTKIQVNSILNGEKVYWRIYYDQA